MTYERRWRVAVYKPDWATGEKASIRGISINCMCGRSIYSLLAGSGKYDGPYDLTIQWDPYPSDEQGKELRGRCQAKTCKKRIDLDIEEVISDLSTNPLMTEMERQYIAAILRSHLENLEGTIGKKRRVNASQKNESKTKKR